MRRKLILAAASALLTAVCLAACASAPPGMLPAESPAAVTAAPSPVSAETPSLIRDTHPAYLFPDELGRTRPREPMTRGEAALMFAALIEDAPESAAGFFDVPPEAACAGGAALLKTLGVVDGETFEPERPLTLGELLCMLSHFYPPARASRSFADAEAGTELGSACSLAVEQGWLDVPEGGSVLPHRMLTRLETAELMNRVLGRGGEEPGEEAEKAAALRDLPPNEAERAEMLEAVVTHGFAESGGSLVWVEAEWPFSQLEGYSSGSWKLDGLLVQILSEQLPEGTDDAEARRLLYRYVRDSFRYQKGDIYPKGDVSWLVDEAVKLASTGRGNCYSYAALLCELYRAIGLDAEVYSGTFVSSPHAWVEAEIDGVRYIYDVETEYSYIRQRKYEDMFERTYEQMSRYQYER